MKRRLNLESAHLPAPTCPDEPAFRAKDNSVIFAALSRSTCPDCGQRGLSISRINGRRTHFHCLACDARFELDWTNVACGNLSAGVIVERFVTCRLCGGNGNRPVRQPPYNATAPVKMQTCCDCNGSGQRKA